MLCLGYSFRSQSHHQTPAKSIRHQQLCPRNTESSQSKFYPFCLKLQREFLAMGENKLLTRIKRSKSKPEQGSSDTKKISFNSRVQYHAVPYVSDVDREVVWYSSKEYSAAREREDFIRRKVSENDALFRKNEENLTAQGILTNQDIIRKIQNVDSSVLAVLEEQDEQEVKYQLAWQKHRRSKKKNKGRPPPMFLVNDEKVAKAYKPHSKKASKEAQNRALRHQKHLEDIAADPSIPSEPLSPTKLKKKPFSLMLSKEPPTMPTLNNPLLQSRGHLPPLAEDLPQESRCANPAA